MCSEHVDQLMVIKQVIPQTAPTQLSYLSQEVSLELHPIRGPELVQCHYMSWQSRDDPGAPERAKRGSVSTRCGSTDRCTGTQGR